MTYFCGSFCLQKSSLTENWQSACGKSGSAGGNTSETNHRYIVYRQPISLDRFFIHDIGEGENASAKLDYAFVLVSLNRFQQIIAVHTFQAPAEQVKVSPFCLVACFGNLFPIISLSSLPFFPFPLLSLSLYFPSTSTQVEYSPPPCEAIIVEQ